MSAELYLGIDTSHSHAQLLLFNKDQIIAESSWEKAKSHSEVITTRFQSLLSDHSKSINDIKKIFCVTGPGSFTGLRVGINFGKALAYSLECSMGSINTLDLLALNASDSDLPILATVDAQKNSIFYSLFKKEKGQLIKIRENAICEIRNLGEILPGPVQVCGLGLTNYMGFLDDSCKTQLHIHANHQFCDLKNLINGTPLISLEQDLSWEDIQPFYIKASAPEEKLNPTI